MATNDIGKLKVKIWMESHPEDQWTVVYFESMMINTVKMIRNWFPQPKLHNIIFIVNNRYTTLSVKKIVSLTDIKDVWFNIWHIKPLYINVLYNPIHNNTWDLVSKDLLLHSSSLYVSPWANVLIDKWQF